MSLTGRDEKGIQELDRCMTDKLMRRLREVEQERDELAAHCEMMKKAYPVIMHEDESYHQVFEAACSVFEQSPKQSLAQVKADAIDAMFNEVAKEHTLVSGGCELTGMWAFDYQVHKYCNKLRQQAKEGVK